MGNPVDRLFQEWHRLGGAVLLAEVDTGVPVRSPEEVLAETTAHCRESGRLTWVALDWLIKHIAQIDEQLLLRRVAECGDLTVLGVLCDAAREHHPDPKLDRLIRACSPNREIVPFFHRVAQSPLASRLARESPLDVFRRWNYISGELRYLSTERFSP